jgi:uncharacterized membrane protein YphA (DoxX/SURF4 family)
MNNFTRFFLVLLRLAIGWLFLFEGIEKVESLNYLPTGRERPFSSAGYLRESAGPLSDLFHQQAGGDPDEMALERFAVKESASEETAGRPPAADQLAPALRKDFEDLVQRYAAHYGFDDAQRARARDVLEAHEQRMARWLTGWEKNEKVVENSSFPAAPFRQSFVARVNAYRDKVAEVRRLRDDVAGAFGKDVSKQQLRTLKADAARMRADLLLEMEGALKDALKDPEKGVALTDEQKKKPAPAPPEPPALLRYTDLGVSYGLVVIGACLILGLLTRTNCLLGAAFLVALYLALPSWPWLPENPRAEGHYLFVSKNLILALALLALAGTRSGRWFGLDALLQFLRPSRRRAPAAPAEAVPANLTR